MERSARHTLLFFLLALITACSSSSAPLPPATQADLQAVLETEWRAFTGGSPNYGGIAMQILSPKGDYFLSAGMGAGMSNSHRFRTASVTKTFTAAAIMLLHNRGQLNIDHKLSDNMPGTSAPYFPYAIPHRGEITIRLVLMHRAGIFDLTNTNIAVNSASAGEPYVGGNYIAYVLGMDSGHQFTFDELFSVIERDEQVGFEPPDSRYRYSDTGYTILAYIVERVSGKTYEAFVRDEFLQPLGLFNTTLPWQGADQDLPAPFLEGYVWSNGALTGVTRQNMSAYVGNGNMITTPLDLATWARKLLSGRAGLPTATVDAMKSGLPSTGVETYGLGIKYHPELGYGHGGDHEGYITFMYYRPDRDIAYVVVVNSWDLSNYPLSLLAQHDFIQNTANRVFARMGY